MTNMRHSEKCEGVLFREQKMWRCKILCKDIVYIYPTAGLVNGITYIGMVRYSCKRLSYLFQNPCVMNRLDKRLSRKFMNSVKAVN